MFPQRASSVTLPAVIPIHDSEPEKKKLFVDKGSAFWLAYISIISSIFLSALDLTAVSTVLPTITADLDGGDEFTWVGSAYALASTAILPLCGALSDIFGRKPIMQGAIVFFSVGSALAGAAKNMSMLIGARSKRYFCYETRVEIYQHRCSGAGDWRGCRHVSLHDTDIGPGPIERTWGVPRSPKSDVGVCIWCWTSNRKYIPQIGC